MKPGPGIIHLIENQILRQPKRLSSKWLGILNPYVDISVKLA